LIIDCPLRHRQHGLEHVAPELVGDALLQHLASVPLPHTVLDDIVQNAGDDGVLILVIASEDDRYIRRMRQIGKSRPLPDLAVVMLRRERQRVVDAIGVTSHTKSGSV
jgi:hypothetical protein